MGIDSGELKPSDPISKIFKSGFVPNASGRTALNARGMSNEEINDRIADANVRVVGEVVSGFGDMWNWVQQHPGYAVAAGAVALVGAFVGYDYVVGGGALAAGGLDAAAGTGAGALTLYRAAGPDELASIMAEGDFTIPEGMTESKYFATSLQELSAWMSRAGGGPYTIVETSIPLDTLGSPDVYSLMISDIPGGINTVVVGQESLPRLSTPMPWNLTPVFFH